MACMQLITTTLQNSIMELLIYVLCWHKNAALLSDNEIAQYDQTSVTKAVIELFLRESQKVALSCFRNRTMLRFFYYQALMYISFVGIWHNITCKTTGIGLKNHIWGCLCVSECTHCIETVPGVVLPGTQRDRLCGPGGRKKHTATARAFFSVTASTRQHINRSSAPLKTVDGTQQSHTHGRENLFNILYVTSLSNPETLDRNTDTHVTV